MIDRKNCSSIYCWMHGSHQRKIHKCRSLGFKWLAVLSVLDMYWLTSNAQQLSCVDCLKDKHEDYQNCSVSYCVPMYSCAPVGILTSVGLGLDLCVCVFFAVFLGRISLS